MEQINKYSVILRKPHEVQKQIWDSKAKRKIIRAGRRGGKTVIAATICVDKFLEGLRPLYAAPTAEQLDTFWFEVKKALAEPITAGIFKKNETEHTIETVGTKNRIKGKTAWDANTLRGDYADFLVFDEFQHMNEDVWHLVGAPMLLDNDGDAMFIYTPPSLHSRSASKARDPLHAAKLFKKAKQDKTGRWATFHFSSHVNPHISKAALGEITQDMSQVAYQQEILAEDIEESPGALWSRELINKTRRATHPDLARIVVGVDPTGSSENECGIVVAGKGIDGEGYVLDDRVRAEPIVAAYEHGTVHHVGEFPQLENEMVMWIPGESRFSPNRLDALVWAITELKLSHKTPTKLGTKLIMRGRSH
jgi:hypothetical protein